MNYNPSTIARVGDIGRGITVSTGSLAATTYLLGAANTQTELFDLRGLVFVTHLFIEITSAMDANATQVAFNATFTTPAVAVQPMCAKCASIATLARGRRIVWVGGAVATAAVITASAGISDVTPTVGHYIGGKDFVGTIGMLASDASQAGTGVCFATVCYYPMYDGAYLAARL